MTSYTETITLSNGAKLRVRIERGLTNDVVLHEQNDLNPFGGGRIYWLAGVLFLMFGDELLRMQNARYEFAETASEAAEKALAFFLECAETCIQHAKAEGIPIADCYVQMVNL
ncbi:hypothetical protein ABT237_12585 [Streptomyces sp. NPDC001581]|uniref:hypothetical protein n=1 Tax=Streptomyces sp. NPDC001581 TaxID=3154386 RepID=UPI00332B2784